ncbi:MAG: hypothetical protein ACTHM1_02150 [Solirubrobacteraceae bacterium]
MAATDEVAVANATFVRHSADERQAFAQAVGPRVASSNVDVAALLEELAPYEEPLLAWIGSSAGNERQFMEDPISAVESAQLGIGAESMQALRAASEALAASAVNAQQPPAVAAPAQAALAELATGAPELKTKGWDLIASVTQEALNTTVAAAFNKGEIPHTITQPIKLGPLGEGTVTVNVEAPTVDLNPNAAAGQSGFVGIKLPIVSGMLKFTKEIPIPAGSIEVVTNISYVHLDSERGGTTERLSLDFNNKLAVYNVIIEEPTWEQDFTEFVEIALKDYFQSLAPGAIYLGDVEIPKSAEAFAPVGESDFAIQVNTSKPSENVLLLLMTTSSGKIPPEPGATDFSEVPSLVPSGRKSALYISNRLLIEGLIVPALEESLKLQASSFSFSGSPTSLYSATFSGDLKLAGEYEPELTNLNLSVNGSGQVQGNYEVHAHPLFNAGETYYVLVNGSIFVTPSLNTTTQAISFATSANSGSGTIKCSVLGWIIVAAAIIASFGTLGAFIAAVLAIVVPIIITQLKFPVSLPTSLLSSIENSLGSFVWPAQKSYPLAALELPGDLVFIGEPVI